MGKPTEGQRREWEIDTMLQLPQLFRLQLLGRDEGAIRFLQEHLSRCARIVSSQAIQVDTDMNKNEGKDKEDDMKCCGAERDTPFCPSCGKKIGSPNQLVSLLHYLRKMESDKQKLHDTEMNRRLAPLWGQGNLTSEKKQKSANESFKIVKLKKEITRWKTWADAVEALMNNDHAKVHSDYLEDNNQLEAAQMLRGAF